MERVRYRQPFLGRTGIETYTHIHSHAHLFKEKAKRETQTVCIRSEGRGEAPQKAIIPTREAVCVPSNLTLHHILSLVSTETFINVGYVSAHE